MIISERIFFLLDKRKMTQKELAERVGIANSTVSDWKRKKTNPQSEYIMDICYALEVTPEQLLTGKGIDEDYKEPKRPDYIIEIEDEELLIKFHSLQENQQKRVRAYLELMQDMERLEDVPAKKQIDEYL